MLRNHRLRSRHDFKRVFQRGQRIRGKYFSLQYLPNKLQTNRWAVVVSTKVSKRAVRRNRLRRRLGALVKASQSSLKKSFDLVVVVNSDFYSIDTDELSLEYARMISKSGLLEPTRR